MPYTIETLTTCDQLKELGSALTFEGTNLDDENLEFLEEWLEDNGSIPMTNLTFKVIKGATMNEVYTLTGDNAYPDDLSILCVPLDQLGNPLAITIARFELGGRWFDDVVDNNRRREEEKQVL